MTAYYNEHDPKAAAWLRELIRQGHIAPGDVDERSIEDVLPTDLAAYTQCHFFAGIGVWSYALRQAGWPDDKPVWTGSCPCQPFSTAGKGGGFDDERHLWPAWFWLISQCRPATIFGEQVASRDGLTWLDLVQSDMEGAGYAIGTVDLCAAGFGAPHIRQRLYFVADAQRWASERRGHELGAAQGSNQIGEEKRQRLRDDARDGKPTILLADTNTGKQGVVGASSGTMDSGQSGNAWIGYRRGGSNDGLENSTAAGLQGATGESVQGGGVRLASDSGVGSLANSHRKGSQGWSIGRNGASERFAGQTSVGHQEQPGPTNGFWRDADWLFCRDGKWRSVEPGSSPLVDRTPARVGRLRGYGNAIVAPVATGFIKAYMDARHD